MFDYEVLDYEAWLQVAAWASFVSLATTEHVTNYLYSPQVPVHLHSLDFETEFDWCCKTFSYASEHFRAFNSVIYYHLMIIPRDAGGLTSRSIIDVSYRVRVEIKPGHIHCPYTNPTVGPYTDPTVGDLLQTANCVKRITVYIWLFYNLLIGLRSIVPSQPLTIMLNHCLLGIFGLWLWL